MGHDGTQLKSQQWEGEAEDQMVEASQAVQDSASNQTKPKQNKSKVLHNKLALTFYFVSQICVPYLDSILCLDQRIASTVNQ